MSEGFKNSLIFIKNLNSNLSYIRLNYIIGLHSGIKINQSYVFFIVECVNSPYSL